jgi:hypothetical protein
MAIFKRKSDKKAKSSASSKRKAAEMAGVKLERAPTEADQVAAEMDAFAQQGYEYLRIMIDRAIMHYYRNGSFDRLDELVEKPLLDRIKKRVLELRKQDLLWAFPKRKQYRHSYEVVGKPVLDKNGFPKEFMVEERFADHSIYQHFVNGEPESSVQCPGRERRIRATIHVRNNQDFLLKSVVRVSTGA